ncbi:hypothetical protein HEK131_48960 [Streptomyces seoulensis]|nr:hypothetical protein HEK131_48960 [Streptomyces seoulensis]
MGYCGPETDLDAGHAHPHPHLPPGTPTPARVRRRARAPAVPADRTSGDAETVNTVALSLHMCPSQQTAQRLLPWNIHPP